MYNNNFCFVSLKNFILMKKTDKSQLKKLKGSREIVMEIILSAVGICLAWIFKSQLSTIITTAFTSITTSVNNLLKA